MTAGIDPILFYVVISYVIMIIICKLWKDHRGAIPMDEYYLYYNDTQEEFDEAERERHRSNKKMYICAAPLFLPIFTILWCIKVFWVLLDHLIGE